MPLQKRGKEWGVHMAYLEEKASASHNISLESRRKLRMDGVEEVSGFDESTVMLRTNMGLLTVSGEQLHIGRIDPELGIMELDGKITELSYSDASPAASFWHRLFG